MTESSISESRTYRHTQCGGETTISDQTFELVSNPMSSMEQTQCVNCNAMFPLSGFEWTDTGETIADYYARHTKSATDLQRFLCSKKFMVGVILLSAFLTAGVISVLIADNDLLARIVCFFGGLVIGAMIGMAISCRDSRTPSNAKFVALAIRGC